MRCENAFISSKPAIFHCEVHKYEIQDIFEVMALLLHFQNERERERRECTCSCPWSSHCTG
jgi:hypothetical protein